MTVWSYSFFSALDTCPHMAFRKFIARDVSEKKTDDQRAGTERHNALQKRIERGIALPDELRHLEPFCVPFNQLPAQCEVKLGVTKDWKPCDFFADDVAGRCAIDVWVKPLIVEVGFITDWKNGKVREDPFQLELEALIAKCWYPELQKVTGIYAWIKLNKMGQVHDLSNFNRTYRSVEYRLKEADTYRQRNDWPKTKGPLCGWCPVKDCEHNPHKD